MNTCKPLPQLIAVFVGAACLTPRMVPAQDPLLAGASSATLRSAYLECDRVSSQSSVDQDFMITCERIGDALRDRDFGGDFERLLHWWRGARDDTTANIDHDSEALLTPTPAADNQPEASGR